MQWWRVRKPANTLPLTRYLRRIDQALSRTSATGTVATGVHGLKRPALLSGDDLLTVIDRNRSLSAEFISWQAAHRPTDRDGITAAVIALAWLVNLGITDGGLYRAWPYDVPLVEGSAPLSGISPTQIAGGLDRLTAECLDLSNRSMVEIARQISRVEWEIGVGPLHPFYDGCGRVSRYFSTLLCLWHNVPMPIHTSREEYMRAATSGEMTFADYWISMPHLTLAEL